MRLAQDGTISLMATGIPTYLVRVGPDGLVYTTNGEVGMNNVIQRTDPDTGVTEEVLKGRDGTPPFEARVLDFSPDLTRMYIGTHTNRSIYVVDLDKDLNPISAPVVLAASVGSWHDGLGVDACGYLWVASYDDQSTYRVSPDGSDVRRILQSSFADGMYGHGVFWGSGEGGFREDALYVLRVLMFPMLESMLGGVRLQNHPVLQLLVFSHPFFNSVANPRFRDHLKIFFVRSKGLFISVKLLIGVSQI